MKKTWFFTTIAAVAASAFCAGCGIQQRPGALAGNGSDMAKPPLPIWATPEELKRDDHLDLKERMRRASPPAAGLRTPAEYEPALSVVMAWTSYESFLQKIAISASAAGAAIWMLGGPAALDGVDDRLYQPIDEPFNSVWARDYGPIGIDETTHKLGIIDTIYRHHASRPDDDLVPQKIAAFMGVTAHEAPLILDGGNFMTDGMGNLFMTVRTYEWNDSLDKTTVENTLKAYFGIHTIHWFHYAGSNGHPADGTGHIDMFAKLLAPCKVLVASSTDKGYQKPLDEAAAYFAALPCAAEGRPYDVYRVKGWVRGGTWYTYTNSLIVNKSVIIPSYAKGYDKEAQQVYAAALPDHKIEMVPSDSPIVAGGSIHCTTKEIPRQPADKSAAL